jgi:hypothetical protein
MRKQDRSEIVADREATQERYELSRFGSVDFVAGLDIGEAVEHDEARLVLDDHGLDPAPIWRWRDAPSLEGDRHHGAACVTP